MTPTTPVTTLPFVGPKYAKLLEKLGIKTAADLLYHLPKRYIDLSQITPIDQLLEDELQVVKATVTQIKKSSHSWWQSHDYRTSHGPYWPPTTYVV